MGPPSSSLRPGRVPITRAQNSAEAAAIVRQLAVPGGLLSGLCADRTNEAPSFSDARAEQSAAGGATAASRCAFTYAFSLTPRRVRIKVSWVVGV
eukprot:scaffold11526_cov79-Phaeocystis_antarctica.AAC.1